MNQIEAIGQGRATKYRVKILYEVNSKIIYNNKEIRQKLNFV